MSDHSQGDGWWIASDGKWYPPETHPDRAAPAAPAPGAPTGEDPTVGPEIAAPTAVAPSPAGSASFALPGSDADRSPGPDPTLEQPATAVHAIPLSGAPPSAPALPPVPAPPPVPEPPPMPGESPAAVPLGPPQAPLGPGPGSTIRAGTDELAWYRQPATMVIGALVAAGLVVGGIVALTSGDDGGRVATAEPTVEPTAEPGAAPTPTAEPSPEPTISSPSPTPAATPTTVATPTAVVVPPAEPGTDDGRAPDTPGEQVAPDPDAIVQFVDGGLVEGDYGAEWLLVLENTSADLGASSVIITLSATGADGTEVATSFGSVGYIPPGSSATVVGTFYDADAEVVDFSANWEWLEDVADPARDVSFTIGRHRLVDEGFSGQLVVPISHDADSKLELLQVSAAFYRKGRLTNTEYTYIDVAPGETVEAVFFLLGDEIDDWDEVRFAVAQ